MNDYVTIINDQEKWFHAYNEDAIVLHSINGNRIVPCSDGNEMVGFPVESLNKVISNLRNHNIDYKINDDEIYKNKNNNYIKNLSQYNSEYMDKVIDNIEGRFTVQFNNENPETIVINEINKNAEIIKTVLSNDAGSKIKINGEDVTILEKNINFKNRGNLLLEKKELFVDKLNKQGEIGFIHATAFENLDSIFKCGKIYSRDKCEELNIKFRDSANHAVLDLTDNSIKKCVRFYFRPKTPALCNFYTFNYKICLLVFDYSIINHFINGQIVDRIVTNNKKNKYSLNSISDMLNITYNFDYYKTFYKGFVDQYSYIWDYKSAELLIRDSVDISYLKEIVFPNEYLRTEFNKRFGFYNIKTRVDISLF